MTDEQVAFGSELQRERERRKISLVSVADITKINQSLLAALERGDATRWPSGIYRRAFFREYAATIGVSTESIVTEFARLFPDGGATGPHSRERLDAKSHPRLTLAPRRLWSRLSLSRRACGAAETLGPDSRERLDVASNLRLTLAPGRHWSRRSLWLRACGALLDWSAVFAATVAVETLAPVDRWAAVSMTALIYYSVASVCLGYSPGLWLLNTALVRRTRLPRSLFHLVSAPHQSTQALVEHSVKGFPDPFSSR